MVKEIVPQSDPFFKFGRDEKVRNNIKKEMFNLAFKRTLSPFKKLLRLEKGLRDE
jgi:hypothetical protein